VVACLLDYPVLHDILDPADWSGRALVNLTNGTPAQARETAGWAAGRGAAYLDGGIMAVPPMIGQPEAFVLYSGSKEQFDRYEPLLNCLGDSKYVGADAGWRRSTTWLCSARCMANSPAPRTHSPW
jgi:3-hydroxyisobutyrate dehydrogenase-like beta-hydroxyacid dehydrogenase